MRNVQIVIPELFLPQQVAKDVCVSLDLKFLEKFLARAEPVTVKSGSLESWLCEAFGVADMAIAPLTLQADGIKATGGYWMRADPVHIRLQRDQMILQTDVEPTAEEAARLCASLNTHFAADGLRFVAPHPRRWYVQLPSAPEMQTQALSQVVGRNVHGHLPQGRDALRWHGVFNEIQMLFFEHDVNQAREMNGKPAINSVWFWGGGVAGGALLRPCAKIISDSGLALALGKAAGVATVRLPEGNEVGVDDASGKVLVVWEGLQSALQRADLNAWQASLQQFELTCMKPLLGALQAGEISKISLEVPGNNSASYTLPRSALWKLWRFPRSLAYYGQA